MTGFSFRCLSCGLLAPPGLDIACPSCGGLYEIAYSGPPSSDAPRLPLSRPGERVSLGEGRTPLIELKRTARHLGLGRLWAKLEFVAPTGSFKDRGSSVLVSALREHGVTEFVEDSSGNAGASLAAYAAAAGLKAHIFAPGSAPPAKLRQARAHGAELHLVSGSRRDVAVAARDTSREFGIPYVPHAESPYFLEGMKALAFELAESEAATADHIVFPVGNGSLLIGARRGFEELREAGRASSRGSGFNPTGGLRPALHAAQSAAVRPVVAAILDEPWDSTQAATTAADGIAVAAPPRLAQIVAAVRTSGGAAAAVRETDILGWQARLAREEGIFCELTSAVAFAALPRLTAAGAIARGATVVVPVTGSGLKDG